jgi:S-adenosylmethionine uptake transporter
MASFATNDAFLKLAGETIPLPQLVTLRGGLATVLVLALALALRGLRFDLGRPAWVLIGVRGLTEVAAAFFFLTALMHMPLANATAILQALPLTVTIGAWLIFGEPVSLRRWLVIGIGFAGMWLIVQPGTEGFSVWSVYALAAMIAVTARDLITRKIPKHVPSMTVTLVTTVVVTLSFGAWAMTQPWVPVDAQNWRYVTYSTLCIVGAYYLSVAVMRIGDVSAIAPFRYTALFWALLLGFLMFGDWPDRMTMLGALIVVGSGMALLWFERHPQRPRR